MRRLFFHQIHVRLLSSFVLVSRYISQYSLNFANVRRYVHITARERCGDDDGDDNDDADDFWIVLSLSLTRFFCFVHRFLWPRRTYLVHDTNSHFSARRSQLCSAAKVGMGYRG